MVRRSGYVTVPCGSGEGMSSSQSSYHAGIPSQSITLEASGFTTVSETRLQALQKTICSAHGYLGF